MYDEYTRFWRQYVAEYGPKTAIFLQVGSFYELYDIQAPNGQTQMNVKEIVDFLGIQLTIKKDDVGPDSVGLFAGFPDYVLHKWAGKLTAAGWTVIVVNQYKDKHGKVTERKVARILTPATHIEALSTAESPTIVALWLVPGPSGPPMFGAATFDLSTGSTYTTSGQMRGTTEAYTSDELLHFLSVFAPRELIVFWRATTKPPSEDSLRAQLNYGRQQNILHVRHVPDQGAFEMPAAREDFLRRLFAPKSLLGLRQYLSLETEFQERALCSLLRFVEDYQPTAFQLLQQTKVWSPDHLLLMGNHALNQLQILVNQEGQGVINLFKYTATTPFGKRALRNRLLSPSADATTIEAKLQEVDNMTALPAEKQKEIFRNLRLIYDLPRLHRKMICSEVTAADLLALQSSYFAASSIATLLDQDPTSSKSLESTLANLFDLNAAAAKSDNKTFLHAAQHPIIADLEAKLVNEEAAINTFLNVIRKIASGNESTIRLECSDKIPYKVVGTKTVLNNLKAFCNTSAGSTALSALPDDQRTFTVHTAKASGHCIESAWLDIVNQRVQGLRERLQHQFELILPEVCAAFCAKTQDLWTPVTEFLETVDVSIGLATEARARNWCRPLIVSKTAVGGLKANELRHPLIEDLLTKVRYISHDVALGSDAETRGWLVYGMNASGKSSLMKSIGIAVHLAQAGCYVPATSFELSPYRSLFTRILNQDNLWAGLSSFAVEMTEMRDILKAADQRTLVLGDELCAGTESVSAKALVAAGIEWLAERGSSYVFATHLHGLTDVLQDPEDLALKVWHLKVSTDPFTGRLIYHRNLEPGSGSSLYGLEVAKAMDVPLAFLDKAHQIRRRLLGSVADEEAPKSSWNSTVTRRACELCGSAVVADLEVHHVVPRADGGSNHASNLMVLCAACHDKHHAKPEVSAASVHLTVTSDGNERILTNMAQSPSDDSKKKGLTDEEKSIVEKELTDYPNLPIKKMVARLKMSHGITVSEATIRKIKLK
jgi:DNA mismatch repair protein MutS